MATTRHDGPVPLLSQVLGDQDLTFDGPHEAAWVEVIRKMEEVYSDLIRYEVDLEEKNAALADAERFISSVLESVSDVLIVCDRDGRILQVNGAFARLVGEPADEIAERFLDDYLRPVGADAPPPDFSHCGPGDEIRDVELRFAGPGGASDLYAVNCSARRDQQGRRAGFVLTGRPVGELRRAYEALHRAHRELQQAQRQLIQQEKMASLGRLVAGVAHELNNPISFIHGNVHVLEKYRDRLVRYLDALHAEGGSPGAEALRNDLRIDALMADLSPLIEGMNEGATRVTDIVKNLRRLSFSETGEPEPIDLRPLIERTLRWAAKSSRQAVRMETDLAGECQVRGHEGQLHQVLANLVQNALDAVREVTDPEVRIVTRDQRDMVVLEVRDNGPGIPEDARGKIFDPFFTTKPVGEGTGLGLWIIYGILKDHDAAIEVDEAPGGGACFRITFPRR